MTVPVAAALSPPSRVYLSLALLNVLQVSLLAVMLAAGQIRAAGADVAVAAALVVAFEGARRVAFVHARVAFLLRFARLTPATIREIDGPRIHLGATWLDDLQSNELTKKHLKAADILFRKGGHVLSLIVLFLFHRYIAQAAMIVALSAGSFLLVGAQIAAMHVQGDWWRGLRYLFGASDRIRDGRFAKYNSMMASVALNLGVVATYFAGTVGLREEDFDIASEFILLPLTFGDALGEIVGTPFGRRRFSVSGFGETNLKSVEGCVAVFLGSLLPCSVAAAVADVTVHTWALPAILAAVTTAVETISFRSTDNLTIPLANAAVLVAWARFLPLTPATLGRS